MQKLKIALLLLSMVTTGIFAAINQKDNGKKYYRDASGVFLLKDGLTGTCESGVYNCEYKFNGITTNVPISQTASDYTATGTVSRVFMPD
ncbi:hypothetical protein SAMN05421788_1011523 [Filimonas lacunae]|uniref:Uncharacterized protein n=1 Tax=Filimonas lacunae TaxID=477680 RepID=A0A173MR13_9BACT|nr:hypothetical protein [Filimonas lacunae]BAV10094.1 hypothetical protein FLA_6149 [Filimonas lacunae]SIS83928.1 hypothetical protein SAMN05421788_1011523 [Filimonas lacunae]